MQRHSRSGHLVVLGVESWLSDVELVLVVVLLVVIRFLGTHRHVRQPASTNHSASEPALQRQSRTGQGVVISVRVVSRGSVVLVTGSSGSRRQRQMVQPCRSSLYHEMNAPGLHLHWISPVSGHSDCRWSSSATQRQDGHPSARSHTSSSHAWHLQGSTGAQLEAEVVETVWGRAVVVDCSWLMPSEHRI